MDGGRGQVVAPSLLVARGLLVSRSAFCLALIEQGQGPPPACPSRWALEARATRLASPRTIPILAGGYFNAAPVDRAFDRAELGGAPLP
jgi:hypothetical protein